MLFLCSAKKPLPDDIYISDDVLALLDNTDDEIKDQGDEAPPMTPPVRPKPNMSVTEPDKGSSNGNVT